MSGVTLRVAKPADEEFLHNVYASTRTQELAQLDWDDAQKAAFLRSQSEAQLAHYREHYMGAEYLVVVRDGVDVGRLLVHRNGDDLRLMDIALLPDARGAGIGTSLVQDLVSEAREIGKPVVLHVEEFNPAMRLYERLGFAKTGQLSFYTRMEWSAKEAVA
ncbi:MAG: GNAT family N-acetyltransferase [Actinomycetota bacterium]|jgi:ribosomal protein S18 acetylase RimI-like enzyme|nr:GNAT family N-acetyltransferase [Actinomycetota bacterium]